MGKEKKSNKVSKAKWKNSWRKEFMDYDDKKAIASNTLSKVVAGK